ncbi:UDP-glucuronic acid decarboxylase family protein [Streptomyces alanosinicus]|uniref:Epimerase n=1 Tax=Streptomyces alanosinicus TaxID=68171 RepID=A0A918YGX0_9ACTN|nr:UDP-glucuronic acid decarboxylase family protein [Streptomyces alanosinicus]GHE01643.1 epimerase [Streptomyces alanosinicus]
MKKRAVVVGGAGFVGSHLCERLLAESYEVLCLDNFSTGTRANLSHLLDVGPIEVVSHDATEPLRIDGPVDVVLNLASPASPVDYLRLPVETLKVGSIGTLNTLELARERGAKYLFASTSEVYGDPQVHPQQESYWGHVNPIGVRSVYDEGKRFSESAVTTYRKFYGLDASIFRIFNTYGPRMRQNDGRAIPTFITQALRSEPITISGDGQQTRSVCYVSDLVEGIVRLLRSEHNGPVNLGNPEEMTMLDLAMLIRTECGSASEIEFIPRPQDDPERRKPDISLAKGVLGWAPEVPTAEGLKRTISWFADSIR